MHSEDQLDTARLESESFLAKVEHHGVVSSTQDIAHQRAATAKDLPLLVIADEQTAGRGRGSNSWWTGPGSLAFSLLFDPGMFGLESRPIPQASLATAAAMIDATARWIGEYNPGLHWPNDVFVKNRKLAGILIDALPDGRHIVGVGLNVNNWLTGAPSEVQMRGVSMVELTQQTLDRTEVLLAFLSEFQGTIRQLATDPDELGLRFDELCLQNGHDLTIESAGRRTSGRCAGIAPDGALLLDTLNGRQTFYSGVLV